MDGEIGLGMAAPAVDEDDTTMAGAVPEVEETQELRMLIENNQVGGIIGKGGANVAKVRETAGVFLSILKAEPSVAERVLVLKGQYGQLAAGISMITKLLIQADAKFKKESPDLEEGVAKLRLLVHRHAVGAVIGKGGSAIKETQQETGARVQVSNDPLPQSTEKTVTFTGTPDAIHQAALKVLDQLRANPLRPGTKHYPYVPGPSPYASPHSPFGLPPGAYHPGQFHPHAYAGLQQAAPGLPFGGAMGGATHGAMGDFGGAMGQGAMAGAALAGPANTQKIAIPTICAGCVIGKGGAVIRDLRAQSGTNISISDADATNPNERVVTLTGTPTGIQTAIFLIRQLVEQYNPPARAF